MEQDRVEESTESLESYTGDQIDSIRIRGSEKTFEEVNIRLKDGSYITMLPKMSLTEFGIIPCIIVERRKWGKVGG